MLGTDHEIYEKFVAITAIVKIPGLRFSIMSGVLNFSWQGGPLTEMSMIVFRDLEPIEIVQRLEYELEKTYQIKPLTYRADLSGYRRNPFSSQN
jgi:hypothetical protein